MISARCKGHEERIMSAGCVADLHVKLAQMPFNIKEDSACCLLMIKSASGLFQLSRAAGSLSALAKIHTETPVKLSERQRPLKTAQ
jgi:hypothetical protein